MKCSVILILCFLFTLNCFGQKNKPDYCLFFQLVFSDSGCRKLLNVGNDKDTITITTPGIYKKIVNKCNGVYFNSKKIYIVFAVMDMRSKINCYEFNYTYNEGELYHINIINRNTNKLLHVAFKKKKSKWELADFDGGVM